MTSRLNPSARFARRIVAIFCTLMLAGALLAPTSAQAAGQTVDQFYDPTKISDIYLTIPTAGVTALNDRNQMTNYTAAMVILKSPDGQQSPNINIGLKLKGSTSLEKLSGRPSFKIKFNWSAYKGQRFLGLKHMVLNAMTQDTSMLHETAAYRLYNQMGVPAPKTGFARVYVNGVFKALYVNIEAYDDIMLSKRFPDVTQHLYEGLAFKDFKVGNDDGAKDSGAFPTREGWSMVPNKADITAAIKTATMKTGASWWNAMAKTFDCKKLIMQFAVDNFTGNWDSYSGPIINNYFVRSNNQGQFTMMPWGTDQTFGENRATPALGDDYFFAVDTPQAPFPWISDPYFKGAKTLPRGVFFQKCLAYAPCKKEYLLNLKAVVAKVQSTKLTQFMLNTAGLLVDYTNETQAKEQVRTIAWVDKQIVKVKAVLKKNGIK
ncbi:MAG: hypothetical protein RL719_514 [Actinomycetota bacterium]|jgi:hypothetical protein